MSKFFEPIEFPELNEAPVVEKTPVSDVFPGDAQVYISEFGRVFRAIQSGNSDLVKGVIDLKNAPLFSAMKIFEGNPSGPNMRNFLNTVEQDVGHRVRNELITIMVGREPKLEEFLTKNGINR